MLTLLTIGGFLITIARAGTSTAPNGPVIDLGYAKYQGVCLGNSVNQHLGMRYAAAPVANLRWRAPRDPPTVVEIQNATAFQPICLGDSQKVGVNISEDCLFVNVWSPSGATVDSKLPIWVFIQGGGYITNANANFNGSNVVEQSGHNIIVVNFNYRVSVLGFLTGSEKIREDGDLNVGLLDQRKLLFWVRNNIAKFGGDPNHVVIHGSSAGAGSVTHHMSAYGGRNENLFVGAIIGSPGWTPSWSVSELKFAWDAFVRSAGCANETNTMACLRSLPWQVVQNASVPVPYPGTNTTVPSPPGVNPSSSYWSPSIDDDFFPAYQYDLFENGNFIKLPALVGGDTDEGSMFLPNISTSGEVKAMLRSLSPLLSAEQVDAIIAMYPLEPSMPGRGAWFPSAEHALGDLAVTCAGNWVAKQVARYLSPDQIWTYRYNVQDPVKIASGLGVPHTFENTAIWGPGFTKQQGGSYYTTNAPIVPFVMHYYISFVRTLNPNTFRYAGSPEFKSWGPADGERLMIETNATVMEAVPQLQTERCAFFRNLAKTVRM
ncbi:alpha/beta-hydrolase [Thozetella sp. PMI_491]|nr:alpha/beta-hydrolase [Thozetella sp. PMI_491]